MTFRIAARTILHLGAELISSDGIALYELIKNAFDARSPNVQIVVVTAISRRAQRDVLNSISEVERLSQNSAAKSARLRDLKKAVSNQIIEGAPNADDVRSQIARVATLNELREVVQEANSIVVSDSGHGMSLSTLDDAFLTIGTRSKQRLKDAPSSSGQAALLGEKGIGRLAAMRLGERLRVRSAECQDTRWNVLEIDWSVFDHASDAMLDTIHLAVRANGPKTPPATSGTSIEIRALHREWDRNHVDDIARKDFARLNDPFAQTARFPIILKHNQEPITIPRLEKWILQHAHGHCSGTFRQLDGGGLIFSGTMQAAGKQETFAYSEPELLSASKAPSLEVLEAIGPFAVDFYWFNRAKLTALDGIGDLATVRTRLALWTGGLMLFRDGFRVPPYGGPDDDWLDLDRIALSRSGYKLNRAQIVGRVAISQRGNPFLRDQANREGLVDNDEKRALQKLLAHLIQQTFWSFLGRVELSSRPPREPTDSTTIGNRLNSEEVRLKNNLAKLVERVPAVRAEAKLVGELREGLDALSSVMSQVRQMTRDYEEGRAQLLNLAGVGLTVEILAHELNRATEAALDTLSQLPSRDLPAATAKSLQNLGAQLKTLQKRLRVLDPLSTAGRNRKERVDVVQLVRDVMEAHGEQFRREGVAGRFEVVPNTSGRLSLTLVRGMILQVLENLISNSMYWLRQKKRLDPHFSPRIDVVIDTDASQVQVTDNGPGIADTDGSTVFDAFYTKKPTGEGKGLGLFISREIAKYHGASLTLERGPDGVLRTFVLDLEGTR